MNAINHVLSTDTTKPPEKPTAKPAGAVSAPPTTNDTPKTATDSRPKECFSCGMVVEATTERCPKCGKGSFQRKVEAAKSRVVPVRGEDGWKRPDAHELPERLLQKMCHNRLTSLGVLPVHLPNHTTCLKGLPDFLFSYKGLSFAVELKQKSGRIDDDQREWLTRLATPENGWRVSVIYSLPQLDEFIQSFFLPKQDK